MDIRRSRVADGRAGRLAVLGLALAAGLLRPPPARAQLAASLTAQTDFRYRGVSLTDGRPSLSLDVSYDHSSGLYFGGSAIGAQAAAGGARFVGFTDDIGFSRRTDSGLAFDVGVSNARFSQEIPEGGYIRRYASSYTEVYAGLAGEALSVHIHYSPDYFGEHVATLYADADAAVRPARRLRLFAHAGALTPVSGAYYPPLRRERFDYAAGAAVELDPCEVQLAWTAATRDPAYPPAYAPRRQALVLSASVFF